MDLRSFIEPTAESRRRVSETRQFAELPSPMLGKAGHTSDLNRSDMTAETKWDGTRILLVKRLDKARMFVARGTHTEYTRKYPQVIADALRLDCESCILDGEFVFFDRRGNDVFLTIAARRETIGSKKFKYVAFDILEYNGASVRMKPIEERKRLLDRVVPDNLTVITESQVVANNKKDFFEEQLRKGREGVMLKQRGSVYVGGRSTSWLKIKRENTMDVVARGGTRGTGAREPFFGAVHCFYPRNGRLVHIGDVGSGFTNADLRRLTARVRGGESFVIEVKLMELTRDGKMRFPRFLRVRDDKSVEDVMRNG